MFGRKGILCVIEWLIVADRAAAFMSRCSDGFCFISSPPGSNWLSWDSAQQWCRDNGTRLIEITNKDVQNALSSFLNGISGSYSYSDRLFTNGRRDPGSWIWVTKISASSLPPDGQYDATYAFGYLQLTTSRLTLTASRPTDKKQGYICENDSQCTNATGFVLNSRCYKAYSSEWLSWYDARTKCLDLGGDLASFDFINTNQGLNILNGSWLTQGTNYWIGLRREWWTWKESQADVKYSNWLAGYPITYLNDPNDCLCLQASSWVWTVCRCQESRPFICLSEIRSSTTTATTTTTSASTSRATTTTTTTSTTPTTSRSTYAPASSPTASPSLSYESVNDVASTIIISSTNQPENPLLTAPDGSSAPTTAAAAVGQKPKEGLDRDIAIGIGVGVGGGVVVVILVVVVAVVIIRKRSKRSTPEKKEKKKKVKKLQTPDIIAQQTMAADQEENPYVTVIRLPDIGETSVYENAPSDKPETVYADLEFLTKSSLTDKSSADVVSETGSSRPSSPSRLAEADVEVDHIDYNADQYTIAATCATFL